VREGFGTQVIYDLRKKGGVRSRGGKELLPFARSQREGRKRAKRYEGAKEIEEGGILETKKDFLIKGRLSFVRTCHSLKR